MKGPYEARIRWDRGSWIAGAVSTSDNGGDSSATVSVVRGSYRAERRFRTRVFAKWAAHRHARRMNRMWRYKVRLNEKNRRNHDKVRWHKP